MDGQVSSIEDLKGEYQVRAWSERGYNRVASFPFRIEEIPPASEARASILVKTFVDSRNGDRYDSATVTNEGFRDATQRNCA